MTSLTTAVLLSALCTVYYVIQLNSVEIDQIESFKVELNAKTSHLHTSFLAWTLMTTTGNLINIEYKLPSSLVAVEPISAYVNFWSTKMSQIDLLLEANSTSKLKKFLFTNICSIIDTRRHSNSVGDKAIC